MVFLPVTAAVSCKGSENTEIRFSIKKKEKSFPFRNFFFISLQPNDCEQARKAKGMTQEELGKRVGLPKSSISKIEKGQTHISFEDASL